MHSLLRGTTILALCGSVAAGLADSSLKPVRLDPGLGELHHKVSTSNAEAQKFFDQGLKYVYAFNHDAAVRSFQRAAELDPDLAIASWGQALALGPNINLDVDQAREKQACDAVQSARTRAGKASPEERDLIEALAKRYSNDPKADLHKLAEDYAAAMKTLVVKYPDDLDLATLYAESLMDLHPWKLWANDGTPTEGTIEILSTLESVLKRNPQHIGANHYYIHSIEASPHPEKALASAHRLETLAPSAGHLVHMPAHIYQRTGNYAGAAAANEKAAAADREFMRQNGTEGIYPMMYYNHNLQFGSASYSMLGDFVRAKRMADEFGANAASMAKEMPPVEGFAIAPALVLLRFGKWSDALKVPDPAVGPLSTSLWHFARGSAFAKLGDADGAERELEMFEQTRAAVPDDPGFFQNSEKAVVEVAGHVLAGRVAEARGDRAAAISHYRDAVAAQDRLTYDEPPDWYYPVRETLGAALLADAKYAEAADVFRDDLKQNPHNPRSLRGLSTALKRAGRTADARKAERQFRAAWKDAAHPPLIQDY
jgi:tetratricopeptide (TPR) repeat protein